MSGVSVRPWKKGATTRLYVRDGTTGATIGWVNPHEPRQGELVNRERATEFVIALVPFGIARENTLHIVSGYQAPKNIDLSGNRPGEAALKKAAEIQRGLGRSHTKILEQMGYRTSDQNWIQGARGEVLVGEDLNLRLGARGWKVLHSIPIGDAGSDIDHLVIGPPGVIVINTKTHPGSVVTCAENIVRVHGKQQPYARNSRFEASRTKKVLGKATGLDLTVIGAVAYICQYLDIMSQPKDGKVHHVAADDLFAWLVRLPVTLTREEANKVYAHARWSETWRV